MPRSRSRICAATAIITRRMSFPAHSVAKPGSNSIRWCIRRSAAGWATSCTRSPCRPAPPRIDPQLRDRGSTMDNTVHERIRQDITGNPVVLFMKGSPVFPQCGFSAAVVQILSHLGVKFKGIDVLADPGIRQGIKEFSNWPTIPQLYVKGEFVGGCDIIREMFETGELQQLFEEKGVPVRA